jgi:hypothetical protein
MYIFKVILRATHRIYFGRFVIESLWWQLFFGV